VSLFDQSSVFSPTTEADHSFLFASTATSSSSLSGTSPFPFLSFLFFSLLFSPRPVLTTASLLSRRYGTPAPTTPLAKVFFVLYSLIAVPIIASFAVQTVSAVISSVSEKRLELSRISREARDHSESKHHHPAATENNGEGGGGEPSQAGRPSYSSSSHQELKGGAGEGEFEAHARFVLEHWHNFEEEMEDIGLRSSQKEHDNDRAEEVAEEGDEEKEERELEEEDASVKEERSRNAQERLAEETLELACQLESQARALLIMALPRGGKAQTLLRADRNVQRRDVRVSSLSFLDSTRPFVARADSFLLLLPLFVFSVDGSQCQRTRRSLGLGRAGHVSKPFFFPHSSIPNFIPTKPDTRLLLLFPLILPSNQSPRSLRRRTTPFHPPLPRNIFPSPRRRIPSTSSRRPTSSDLSSCQNVHRLDLRR